MCGWHISEVLGRRSQRDVSTAGGDEEEVQCHVIAMELLRRISLLTTVSKVEVSAICDAMGVLENDFEGGVR